MATRQELIDIMHQALDTQLGLVIKTDNPDVLRQKFYAARLKYSRKGVPIFDSLSFHIPPHKHDEVWIHNGEEIERQGEAGESDSAAP